GAPLGGEFLLAIDPGRCVKDGDRENQLAHAEKLFAKILEQEGTRLPSDRRFAARKRTPKEGIRIPRSLHQTLVAYTGES
ncbi:MAG: oxidoreductase, partial [Gammaproteobacteria bacterium]|nr:oxidoreductase [Gammaproteobacteria bacterium]